MTPKEHLNSKTSSKVFRGFHKLVVEGITMKKISLIRVGSFQAAALSSIPGFKRCVAQRLRVMELCDCSSVLAGFRRTEAQLCTCRAPLCLSVCILLAQRCWVCRRGLTVPLAVAGTSHLANILKKKKKKEQLVDLAVGLPLQITVPA